MLIGSAVSGYIDTLLEVQLVDTAYISDFHVHAWVFRVLCQTMVERLTTN